MKTIRSISRFLCLLLAGLILNVSIDMPDDVLYSDVSKSSMHFNEMESLTELVAECFMDMPNAFPERENDDSNSKSTAKKVTSFKYRQEVPEIAYKPQPTVVCKYYPVLIGFNTEFVNEITPPPPKA